MCDSPSLKLVEHLLSEGARVREYDPNVDKLDPGSVEFCSDIKSCLAGSDLHYYYAGTIV